MFPGQAFTQSVFDSSACAMQLHSTWIGLGFKSTVFGVFKPKQAVIRWGNPHNNSGLHSLTGWGEHVCWLCMTILTYYKSGLTFWNVWIASSLNNFYFLKKCYLYLVLHFTFSVMTNITTFSHIRWSLLLFSRITICGTKQGTAKWKYIVKFS